MSYLRGSAVDTAAEPTREHHNISNSLHPGLSQLVITNILIAHLDSLIRHVDPLVESSPANLDDRPRSHLIVAFSPRQVSICFDAELRVPDVERC